MRRELPLATQTHKLEINDNEYKETLTKGNKQHTNIY